MAMKIKPEHLEHMRAEIARVQSSVPVPQYRMDNPTFSSKRVRWDYWRAAGLCKWTCDTLYSYLNDDHIDTALRQIFGHSV